MYKGHRVVVCIPSGRQRYLRVLLPYLLASRHASVVDEVQLWVNTDAAGDLEYFKRMEKTHPKVKRVEAPGPLSKALYDASRAHYQFNDSIFRFYRACVDPGTLYLKMDDDICYLHDDFFTRLCDGVLAREATNYACVANVFNVPYVTVQQQQRGTIDASLGTATTDPRCPVACTDGAFAAHIHRAFLRLYEGGRIDELAFDSREIIGRQRIGAMAWAGRNFARFGGKVGPQDEVELTTRIPEALQMPLWMQGDAIASHFAFSHQRAHLEDTTNLLERYLALSIRLNSDVAA
jgi:hypothetical protein